MTDITTAEREVRSALNATADDPDYAGAWDAFNRILAELDRLRSEREVQDAALSNLRADLREAVTIRDAELDRLRAERDDKASELACLRVAFNDWKVFHSTVRLEVENQILREDAARYRWLRDNPWPKWLEPVIALHLNGSWDKDIDAARKGEMVRPRRET
jgi:hypothetical protein